jgi:hypothetical protein
MRLWSRKGQMSSARYLTYINVYFVTFAASAITPGKMVWSQKKYGPDGPWQAVTVGLGTQYQSTDLFSGGFWDSSILEVSICNNTAQQPVCYTQAAGLCNSSASSSSTYFRHVFPSNGPISTEYVTFLHWQCHPTVGLICRPMVSRVYQRANSVPSE